MIDWKKLLDKIKIYIKKLTTFIIKNFPIWKKFLFKHLYFFTIIIFLIITYNIIHFSLTKFNDIADSKEYSELVSNTIQNLSLTFISTLTLISTILNKKEDYAHEREMKKLDSLLPEKKKAFLEYITSVQNLLLQDTMINEKEFKIKHLYLLSFCNKEALKVANFISIELSKENAFDFNHIEETKKWCEIQLESLAKSYFEYDESTKD